MTKISIQHRKTMKGKPGFVLIAVLLMISALAVFILEFNYDSRIKLHLAENFSLATQALNNADAGIAITMAVLMFPTGM